MKVAFYTLGCKVNLYETEVAMSLFKEKGYEIVDFNELADIYIVNTCSVTNMSDVKSRKMIRSAIQMNNDATVAVMGCYSQANPDDIAKIEGVDIIIGNNNKTKIVDLIEKFKRNNKRIYNVSGLEDADFEDMEIHDFETKTRAFVKIQDGCNNFCSYCIIPYVRGRIRSKEMDKVFNEVEYLVKNGYQEVVLTGIHTGQYGKDLKEFELSDLIQKLSHIEALKRIRISSIEVVEINENVLEQLKNNPKIANHLHIPLQSGCDKILTLMNRRYKKEEFKHIVDKIKMIRPDISITTDVIVGFPNETEEDFMETYQFIKEIGFSALHVFPYSIRKATKAASMNHQVNGKIKKERVAKLMELSKELEENYMEKFVGKELEVLFESEHDGYYLGHSSNYLKVLTKSATNIMGITKVVKIDSIKYPYCYSKIMKI